jgi:hypothetical protein
MDYRDEMSQESEMHSQTELDSQEMRDEFISKEATREILALRKAWGTSSILPVKPADEAEHSDNTSRSRLPLMRVPRTRPLHKR